MSASHEKRKYVCFFPSFLSLFVEFVYTAVNQKQFQVQLRVRVKACKYVSQEYNFFLFHSFILSFPSSSCRKLWILFLRLSYFILTNIEYIRRKTHGYRWTFTNGVILMDALRNTKKNKKIREENKCWMNKL